MANVILKALPMPPVDAQCHRGICSQADCVRCSCVRAARDAVDIVQRQLREIDALCEEGISDGGAGQKLLEMRKFILRARAAFEGV